MTIYVTFSLSGSGSGLSLGRASPVCLFMFRRRRRSFCLFLFLFLLDGYEKRPRCVAEAFALLCCSQSRARNAIVHLLSLFRSHLARLAVGREKREARRQSQPVSA